MFTKQHFEAIASIINKFARHNGTRDYPGGGEVDGIVNMLVDEFARYLETQNDHFDIDKFYEACYKGYMR